MCTSWGERGLAITASLCPLPFPKFSLLSEQRGDRLLHGHPKVLPNFAVGDGCRKKVQKKAIGTGFVQPRQLL